MSAAIKLRSLKKTFGASLIALWCVLSSAVFKGGAGGARALPEFGGSEKGQSLISAYRSLAITTNTPGFKKLSTALLSQQTTIECVFFAYNGNLDDSSKYFKG